MSCWCGLLGIDRGRLHRGWLLTNIVRFDLARQEDADHHDTRANPRENIHGFLEHQEPEHDGNQEVNVIADGNRHASSTMLIHHLENEEIERKIPDPEVKVNGAIGISAPRHENAADDLEQVGKVEQIKDIARLVEITCQHDGNDLQCQCSRHAREAGSKREEDFLKLGMLDLVIREQYDDRKSCGACKINQALCLVHIYRCRLDRHCEHE